MCGGFSKLKSGGVGGVGRRSSAVRGRGRAQVEREVGRGRLRVGLGVGARRGGRSGSGRGGVQREVEGRASSGRGDGTGRTDAGEPRVRGQVLAERILLTSLL